MADFNLAVVILTAKPPNLIPGQIFWLYGIHVHTGIIAADVNPAFCYCKEASNKGMITKVLHKINVLQ